METVVASYEIVVLASDDNTTASPTTTPSTEGRVNLIFSIIVILIVGAATIVLFLMLASFAKIIRHCLSIGRKKRAYNVNMNMFENAVKMKYETEPKKFTVKNQL